MMPGKDFLKSHVLSWWRKVCSDWEDVTSSSRMFQVFGKAQLPTVDRLTGGTRRRLVPVERSNHLPGRLRSAYWHKRSKVRRCTSVKKIMSVTAVVPWLISYFRLVQDSDALYKSMILTYLQWRIQRGAAKKSHGP